MQASTEHQGVIVHVLLSLLIVGIVVQQGALVGEEKRVEVHVRVHAWHTVLSVNTVVGPVNL